MFLVVCEGGTEAGVLDALRAHWRVASVQVVMWANQGAPKSIVDVAVKERVRLGKEAVEPDHVFVVFDRDEHPSFDAALDRARSCGFRCGVSVPCIELWGLLLHRDQHAPLDHHEAQRALREVHPKYCHKAHPYLDTDTVIAGLDGASRRARMLRERNERDDEPLRNPVTFFDEVVEAVRALAPDDAE